METQLENSFLQIPFDKVVERVDGGNVVLRGLISMLQERLDLADREVEFSTRAIRECLHEKEIKQCSVERALGYFKNYHLYNSKDQALLRKSIDDEVLLPLSIQSSKRAAEIAAQHKHLHHEEQRYATAMESLQKTKAKHDKLIEQIKCLHAKLTKKYGVDELAELDKKKGYFHGFFGSLDPEQEREKQKKKLEKLKQEYETSHHELMQKKNIVLESMMSLDRAEDNAADVYERLEKCRLDKISASMKKFCCLERRYLESRLQHLDQLESGAVARLDPVEDANLFVRANKKPSDALRRSYAIHILHLNHLSRALPDDSFALRESEGGDDIDSTGSDVDIMESADGEECHVTTDANGDVKETRGSEAEPVPSAPSEESTLAETPPRSRSATASSAPLDRPSTPEMCIQERIARRNLDAIFGASTEEGSGEDHALSMSSHGGDDSSVASSPAPVKTKSQVSKSKSKSRRKSARLKGSLSEDSLVFSEEHSAAYLAVHPEEWRVLFADADGRKYFLQMLDEKRSRSATLHPRGFRALTTAMQVFLDECEYVKDRTSAMRMANMGNTFHSYSIVSDVDCSPAAGTRTLPPPPLLSSPSQKDDGSSDTSQPVLSPDTDISSPPVPSPNTTGTSARKMYLQREKVIRDHSIWKSHRFWEDALQHGVIGQLKLTEAVVWDELSPEELHEAITAVQNIIFGQLGAMAFTMHEIGIPQNEVEQMIYDLCRVSQLTFDHRKELMLSTSETFKHRHEEEHVPVETITFSPTTALESIVGGPLPLDLNVGVKKDAVFESETKETLDDVWWNDRAY